MPMNKPVAIPDVEPGPYTVILMFYSLLDERLFVIRCNYLRRKNIIAMIYMIYPVNNHGPAHLLRRAF
ncbi:MAG: hypothetical protein JO001_02910 [Alphaproteobacteria bacterium]|nr:hypothetical protein [Alphaproteobacteria bacterium]